MKIRKQVYEVTRDDLIRYPVWEFALDEEGEEGQDEATVRPCETTSPLDLTDGMFVVRAAFALADGARMQGYLTPPVQGDAGLGTLQPVIITDHGQVFFWCGVIHPDAKILAQSYERLGRSAERVFPIQVASDVDWINPPIRAKIPGFVVLAESTTGVTRTIN